MKRMMTLVLLAALTAACGSPTAKNNSGNNQNNQNNENNQNNQTGVLGMNFALDNVGRSSIFVSPSPLTIYDGDEPIAADIYPCSCGRDCLAVEPAPVQEVRPGTQLTWAWQGLVDVDGSCSAEGMIGRDLEAEFCYGRNFTGFSEFEGTPFDIVCERVPFTVAEACPECDEAFIQLQADAEVEPVEPPLRLVLENQTDGSVFIQQALNCAMNQWFSVQHNDTPLDLFQPCGPCDCAEGPDCGIGCDLACPMDEATEVAPGTEHVLELSGTYFKLYDEGTHECTQTQYLPEAPLVAELCWGSDVIEEELGSAIVSNVQCAQVEFALTDREARVIVE